MEVLQLCTTFLAVRVHKLVQILDRILLGNEVRIVCLQYLLLQGFPISVAVAFQSFDGLRYLVRTELSDDSAFLGTSQTSEFCHALVLVHELGEAPCLSHKRLGGTFRSWSRKIS